MMNDVVKPFDYEAVDNTKLDKAAFKITSGEFAGLIISVDGIRFDEGIGDCVMTFDYEVEYGDITDERKPVLENAIGDMIVYSLTEAMKNNTLADMIRGE